MFLLFQGISNCLIVVYVLEMCVNKRQRALNGVLISAFGYFGTLVTYVLGVFLGWRELAAVLAAFSLPYMLGIAIFVPESPQFYIRKGRIEEAMKSYLVLAGEHNKNSVEKAFEVN